MNKRLYYFFVMLVFFVSCWANLEKQEKSVSWEEAVNILQSWEVKSVMQTHSLSISFSMKDGSSIKTKEPKIDAIYKEIEKCWNTCKAIIIATE